MPETINKSFTLNDVPTWSHSNPELLAYARASLEFRARLWSAKTAQARRLLRNEATMWASNQPRDTP